MAYILAAFLLAIIIFIRKIYKNLSDPKPLPHFDVSRNWASGTESSGISEGSEPIPFQVTSSAEQIARLRERIAEVAPKLAAPLQNTAFEYGVNSKQFQSFLKFWKDDYLVRWDERQKYLNQFPQFTKNIQGLNIHYIHTKPNVPENSNLNVVPILLMHGWPGSVREFYEIIPRLSEPNAILTNTVFTVIAPSLPGYGWSQAAQQPGLGAAEVSIVMRNLMLSLGYDRFYVQGGDWGAIVGSAMSTIFPANVIGYHSNFLLAESPIAFAKGIIASFWPSLFVYKKYHSFFFPLASKFSYLLLESGYMHLQATKPDTIGIALTDNPVGLAAYILEKFLTWTDPAGRSRPAGGWDEMDAAFRDGILDNIMVYVLSESITSSMRLYAESLAPQQSRLQLPRVPTEVPTACARFIHDLRHSMDWQLQEKYRNIIQSTYHQEGGHFAAMEKPDVLFEDLVEFIRSVNRLSILNAL